MKKVVLITGCSSGIGMEISKLFIKNGYITYGIARREVNLSGLRYVKGDVTSIDSAKAVVKMFFCGFYLVPSYGI